MLPVIFILGHRTTIQGLFQIHELCWPVLTLLTSLRTSAPPPPQPATATPVVTINTHMLR